VLAERTGGEADLLARWIGDPQWLLGVEFPGGEAFGGGLSRGRYFALGNSTVGPDGDVPVEIVFGSEVETLAQTFGFSGNGISSAGVGTFPGAAYDVSDPENPRRLNICFLDGAITTPNLVWDPDTTPQGGAEFVYVMASDYDGTGETYAGTSLSVPPYEDVLYTLWPRLAPGRALLEADPSSITIDLARIGGLEGVLPENGRVELSWSYDAPPEAVGLRLLTGLGGADDLLADLPPDATTYTHVVAEPELRSYRLESVDAEGAVVDVSTEIAVQTFLSLGATLVGQISPRASYGDVWGYVDPATQREYALLTARFSGLSVIDLDGETLEEVGFVPGLTTGGGSVADAKDVKTYGPYAYVVHEVAPILVVDLTDPADPRAVGEIDVQPNVSDGGSHNALVEGDYLYVVGGRSPGGLRIYDLAADPIAPPLVGEINGEDGQTYYHDLEVVGDLAYAAAINDQGIDVLDLSDRADPSVITTIIYPAASMGAHNVCATPDGQTIFVGDEIGSGRWTRAFDVSDLDDVELIAEIVVDPNAIVHNCYVTDDDRLHIAHYTEGYQVFDVSTPAAPERVAFYDTYAEPGYGFEGAWTAYPYLPSGRTLVSTLGEGLFVVELDGTTVDDEPVSAAADFSLDAPYPNPAAERATVRFTLAETADVRVTLYDVLGRSVAVLADGPHGAGTHTATVATDRLANGAYVVRLDAAGQRATQMLTVQR
jgi:choice-of-anchor B domain-containing protein